MFSVQFVMVWIIPIILDPCRTNANATISAMLIDDGGVFLAVLINKGGCDVRGATGVFFWINSAKQEWIISSDLGKFIEI